MDLMESIQRVRVIQSHFEELLLVNSVNISKVPALCTGHPRHVRKEPDLSEIVIFLQIVDIGMRSFVDYGNSSLQNEEHFSSMFLLKQHVIINCEGLGFEYVGDLRQEVNVKVSKNCYAVQDTGVQINCDFVTEVSIQKAHNLILLYLHLFFHFPVVVEITVDLPFQIVRNFLCP